MAPHNDIMTIDDQVKNSVYHNDSVTDDYELNDKSAKSKLVKGSKRIPFEVEKNSSSCTMIFSVGAWLVAVLPAIRYWNEIKGDKTCKVGDKVIKVSGIKSGKDVNGMCVVSQVVFYIDRDKVVLHLYNTTQRILINGHGYENFIEIFVKPFFETKVQSCPTEIQTINEEVLQKFGPKTVKRSNVNSCDFACKTLSALNKHRNNDHALSFNNGKNLLGPRHSTRNNSIMMVEDLSITEIPDESITLEEDCPPHTEAPQIVVPKENETDVLLDVDDLSCNKCDFAGIDPKSLREHIGSNHANRISDADINKLGGKILTEHFCTLCDFLTDNSEDLEMHAQMAHESTKTADPVNTTQAEVQTLKYNCGKCVFSSTDIESLNSHIDNNHKPNKNLQNENHSKDKNLNKQEEVNVVVEESIPKENEANIQDSPSPEKAVICSKCAMHVDDQESLKKHM